MFPFIKGVCYIRTSRQDCAIIYNSNEDFHVGQAKVRQYTEKLLRQCEENTKTENYRYKMNKHCNRNTK